jgi:hypothetical protein
MSQAINISDDDILYAENILLPEGLSFDEERKNFIRNLNILDLQAVPGSGKTTALLAKLLILERKLPFADGSGILVLSHTNAAIDEIKNIIQKHCPKLFSYPNYIGTIQSFVDEFLAIPFYITKFNKKPIRIDNEIFDEVASSYFKNLPNSGARSWLLRQRDPENFFKNLRFDENLNLLKGMNGEICLRSDANSTTYKTLKTIKSNILKSGFLNYDDAYFLAKLYLTYFPGIKIILQKRFSKVYVDEMQDMDSHQYELLEKIFYDGGNSVSILQRIGDKNQAIYNSVKASEIWNDREIILRLSGSQRLSKGIADIVCKFALHTNDDFNISGLNTCIIKPHILIFEDSTVSCVIQKFGELVKGFKENGNLIDYEKYPIKVIAWNTEWKEQDDFDNISKLRLVDFHNEFIKDKQKPKKDYNYLKSYLLFYDKDKKTLEPIRKNILNSILKVLRIEKVNCEEGRPYTKKKLIEFIKHKDPIFYEEFNLRIYNWSIEIIRGNTDEVLDVIKTFIPKIFAVFSPNLICSSLSFINGNDENVFINTVEECTTKNIYKIDDIELEITSVHSVKGQTHCATLYLESYFQQDGRGANAKSYESQRLAGQFLGNSIKIDNIGDRVKQSTKMAYVGFSRPTNLLCVAIHKKRFDANLSNIDRSKWEIIEI